MFWVFNMGLWAYEVFFWSRSSRVAPPFHWRPKYPHHSCVKIFVLLLTFFCIILWGVSLFLANIRSKKNFVLTTCHQYTRAFQRSFVGRFILVTAVSSTSIKQSSDPGILSLFTSRIFFVLFEELSIIYGILHPLPPTFSPVSCYFFRKYFQNISQIYSFYKFWALSRVNFSFLPLFLATSPFHPIFFFCLTQFHLFFCNFDTRPQWN